MRFVPFLCAVTLLSAVASQAADVRPSTNNPTEAEAIQKASDAYCAAYNKGNVDELVSFWAPDAQYIDGEGAVVNGREKIASYFAEELTATKGHTLRCEITSIRFLKPDLAVEDGHAELTSPDGEAASGRYNAIWLKTDGKWLLARVQDLPSDSLAVASHADRLKQLEWLVGDWTHKDAVTGAVETLSCRWARNKSFLDVIELATLKNGDTVSIERRIGWDPNSGQFKSWFFDSNGGHGEGQWTRIGHTWNIANKGLLADGRTASSLNGLDLVDNDSFIWRSENREIGGRPLADHERKFERATTQE